MKFSDFVLKIKILNVLIGYFIFLHIKFFILLQACSKIEYNEPYTNIHKKQLKWFKFFILFN